MRPGAALLLIAASVSCVTRASRDDASGIYRMNYSAWSDVLELHPNGEFHHTVESSNGQLLDERGRWEWEWRPPEEGVDIVRIEGYSHRVPGMEADGLWPATIERYCGKVRLAVNRDLGIYYYKVH